MSGVIESLERAQLRRVPVFQAGGPVRGDVRRAKLYYLRERVGRGARVRERRWTGGAQEQAYVEGAMPPDDAPRPGEEELAEATAEAEAEAQATDEAAAESGAAPAEAESAPAESAPEEAAPEQTASAEEEAASAEPASQP